MAQITIYLDQDTERIVRSHVKASGESTSKWVADAVRKRAQSDWPADVLALFGSWKEDDFPTLEELRQGYGTDVARENL